MDVFGILINALLQQSNAFNLIIRKEMGQKINVNMEVQLFFGNTMGIIQRKLERNFRFYMPIVIGVKEPKRRNLAEMSDECIFIEL